MHFNLQLLEGTTLPNFLAIREEGGSLLNVAYVFSDLHKKVCFRCGQLAHLGQYCRATEKPITEQGQVWSFLDVPAALPQRPSVEAVAGPSGAVELERVRPPSPPPLGGEDGLRVLVEEPGARDVDLVASPGGDVASLPLGQGAEESGVSVEPALGSERVVRLPASEQGPPFRVLSGRGSEEAASVALSLPSEPFLYLSPDSLSRGGGGATPSLM